MIYIGNVFASPKEADRDIVGYKLLVPANKEFMFHTLISETLVDIREPLYVTDKEVIVKNPNNCYFVQKGFISLHTELSIYGNTRYFERLKHMSDKYFIIKAIIPKGTEYYEGDYGYRYLAKMITFEPNQLYELSQFPLL